MRYLIFGFRFSLIVTLMLGSGACAGVQPTSESAAPTPATATELPPQLTATSPTRPTPVAPSDRSLISGQWQTLIYHDEFKQVMLVNGGPEHGWSPSDPLELWGWDGTRWTLWSADPNGPRWRNWAGVAYDSARGVLVIYGGLQSRGARFADTWEWDGQRWTEYTGPGPGPREGAGMAYDAARGKVVLFGGANGADEIVGETWEWDGQQWTQVATDGPPPRFPSAMAYDAAHKQVLMFGGHFVGETDFQNYSDLWAWDGAAWRELVPDSAPGIRNIASLVFDPVHERVLLFGGGETAFLSDIWAWDGTHWAQIAATGAPARSGSGGAYDAVRDKVVLFGGVARPGGEALTDTWEWDGEGWTCVAGCESSQETASPLASGSDVILYRGDTRRTGAYDFPAIRELPTLQWQKSLNAVGPAPVLADEVLYVSAQNRQLCALNAATGEDIWCASSGALASPVAVAGEAVFANTVNGQALAFQRDTGAKIWSVAISGSGWGAPLVIGEVVYIVSERGVYALEAHTGTVIWEKHTGSHRGSVGSPAWAEGVLYFEVGPTLYALDGATGQEQWKVQRETWFYGPALANGLLYLGNDDGYFYAFDQKTGEEIWKTELAGTGWSAPSIANSVIYVGNINQHIYAYEALTGKTLWKTEVEDWATSDPVVSDGVVYGGSGNHEMREGPRHLYALDAQTGAELWKFKADARLLTAPALSPDAIYIVSVSGAIYALK